MHKQETNIESIISNNKSPMNTSKSKAMYTFSKGDRFPGIQPEGRYTSPHLVFNSTRSNPCSVKEPPPLAMAARSTSPCNSPLTQQAAVPISRQIHLKFRFRQLPEEGTHHRAQQIGLQIHLDFQPDS